jgi:CheY-like chemotaxis protein
LDTLLGNEPVFEPKTRIYQRLLAGDPEEAAELLDEYLESMPLVEVYDTMLIPALSLAETHAHRGALTDERHRFILQSLKEIIEDLGQRPLEVQLQAAANESRNAGDDSPASASNAPPVCVLCLPARDEADEISSTMLAQLLERDGCMVQAISLTARASEMVDLVAKRQPAVVCVSATPPAAVMHARYLCSRLRARLPKVNLVVGLWDTPGDLATATKRIACGANTHVVATLADAQQQVRLLIEPLLPRPERPTEQDNASDILEEARA